MTEGLVIGIDEALRCLAAGPSSGESRRYALEEVYGIRAVSKHHREAALRLLRNPRNSFGAVGACYVIFELLTDNGIATFPDEWVRELPWLETQCDFTKPVWTASEVVVWECLEKKKRTHPKAKRVVLEPETGASLRLSYPALTSGDFTEVKEGVAANLIAHDTFSYDEYLFARNCFLLDPKEYVSTWVALHVIRKFLGEGGYGIWAGDLLRSDNKAESKIRFAEEGIAQIGDSVGS